MLIEAVFAGFGGQGIMLSGQIVAYAGMDQGLNVSWLPSYGPEMRGGTANVSVVVSDQEVASPVVSAPSAVVAMNRPSLEKFAPMMKPNGVLIINSSLIDIGCDRTDLFQYRIDANDAAIEVGNPKAANMIVLGAFAGAVEGIDHDRIIHQIRVKFASKPQFVDLNIACFHKGVELIKEKKGS